MRRIKYDYCTCLFYYVFKRSRKVRAGCMQNLDITCMFMAVIDFTGDVVLWVDD